jgi:hypothetical protein
MKKITLAGVIGGIILFVWSFLAWALLPLHTPHLRTMANEDSVIAALKTGMDAKGVYFFPGMPPPGTRSAEEQQAAEDAWKKKYESGPTGMVVYDPAGSSTMMTAQMITGLVVDILAAMLAAWLLGRSTAMNASYFSRVAYCGTLGIFVSLVAYLAEWNWLGFPLPYTTAMIADAVIGWLLTGLGIGAIVKGVPRS